MMKFPKNPEFAKLVKALREKWRVGQEKAAERLDTNKFTWHRWETEKQQPTMLHTQKRLMTEFRKAGLLEGKK